MDQESNPGPSESEALTLGVALLHYKECINVYHQSCYYRL
jgi:hypothetical protein